MPVFHFLKRPGSGMLKQIISLYAGQGWWNKKDGPELAAALVRKSHCFVVALDRGRVVGMGRAISDGVSDAYIQDVAVLPSHRGAGTGSGIIKALKRRLKKDGVGWVGLIAQDGSSPFYAALGFVQIKRAAPMMLKGNRV